MRAKVRPAALFRRNAWWVIAGAVLATAPSAWAASQAQAQTASVRTAMEDCLSTTRLQGDNPLYKDPNYLNRVDTYCYEHYRHVYQLETYVRHPTETWISRMMILAIVFIVTGGLMGLWQLIIGQGFPLRAARVAIQPAATGGAPIPSPSPYPSPEQAKLAFRHSVIGLVMLSLALVVFIVCVGWLSSMKETFEAPAQNAVPPTQMFSEPASGVRSSRYATTPPSSKPTAQPSTGQPGSGSPPILPR